ncbi:MAG TPA: CoA transferase [Vicinamibacterales bacterium]|nr:CoA transferase [Vicinamibacterales bacterium]
MTPPLAGVRVLDLTRLLPGAFATLMLAELGAEIIKIEDPTGGDPMRHLPPLVGGRGLYDRLLNRGKKSVALDLRAAPGREAVDRLLAQSDVMIESFRPRTARRLGVSAGQVRARHPRVVHASITGYGQTGPYAERPGHDLNYVALSGLLAADRPGATSLPRLFIADVGGGAMHAVVAILAALLGRARHGEGAAIDISMHEAALYWMMLPAARELVEGAGVQGTPPFGDELPTFGRHACYNVYRTADGTAIALGALEPKFWQAFCAAVGRSDLAARHLGDEADQAALMAEVAALFATRTRDEWLTFFAGHDVCLTPVNAPAEALADAHVVARGAVVAAAGGARAIRAPFLAEPVHLAPAPELGAHTAEILGDGWSSSAQPVE